MDGGGEQNQGWGVLKKAEKFIIHPLPSLEDIKENIIKDCCFLYNLQKGLYCTVTIKALFLWHERPNQYFWVLKTYFLTRHTYLLTMALNCFIWRVRSIRPTVLCCINMLIVIHLSNLWWLHQRSSLLQQLHSCKETTVKCTALLSKPCATSDLKALLKGKERVFSPGVKELLWST